VGIIKVLSRNLRAGTKESHEKQIRKARVTTEIGTQHFSNTGLDCYCRTDLLGPLFDYLKLLECPAHSSQDGSVGYCIPALRDGDLGLRWCRVCDRTGNVVVPPFCHGRNDIMNMTSGSKFFLDKLIVVQIVNKSSSFYRTPNILLYLHKSKPFDSILNQLNPVHTNIPHFSKIHFNIILTCTSILQKGLIP
jgi:hypothetical protein